MSKYFWVGTTECIQAYCRQKILINQNSEVHFSSACQTSSWLTSQPDLFCLPRKLQLLTYLPRLVVEPHQSVIPGQHLAVEGGVVLGRATPGHGAPDLDRLIQVDMAFLKRVWIRATGEHGQRWRHWGWLGSATPTRDERQGFLIQTDLLLQFSNGFNELTGEQRT